MQERQKAFEEAIAELGKCSLSNKQLAECRLAIRKLMPEPGIREVTYLMITELHEQTGLSVHDCRQSLLACNGNMEEAYARLHSQACGPARRAL